MSQLTVKVYDKNDCKFCVATEELLSELNVEYETVNMSYDKEALQRVKKMGYRSAPVVVLNEDTPDQESWSGHDEEKIRSLFDADCKKKQEEEAADDDAWDF